MKYPIINKQPRREVNVPKLSGGLNLRDSLINVRDNQMTDCVNVWYKNGILRTRPPFVANDEMILINNAEYDKCYLANVETHNDIKKDEATLVSAWKFDGYEWDYRYVSSIVFWWQYPDRIETAGKIDINFEHFMWEDEDSLSDAVKLCSCFVVEKDGVAYCYAWDGKNYYISKLDYLTGSTEWEEAGESERYVPTVYAHCQRTGWDDFSGTQFEGYNLIGNSYKMKYSAYNESDSDKTHPMRYALGLPLAKSGVIKATITTYDAQTEETMTIEHAITYNEENYNSFSSGEIMIEKFGEGNTSLDGLRLFVKYNYIGFCFTTQGDGIPGKEFFVAMLDSDEKIKKYGCNEDNIEITAQYDIDEENLKKIFCMTRSTWFGGSASGINGGSRLFLCGNKNEKEKSLVVWSSLNNPLYFPENNYAYVGDRSQSVKAFGKQSENLIIFKEKSTYYSYYVSNDSVTADDLINQSVVDYDANIVCFPMMQLNATIGCDCPNTVQLCRNRLVWANSDGNVYTLYSNNQYNERTIYKVSDLITSALSKETDLKNAVSCDFEGHYLLGTGNNIYVMDYNSYGYQYASSYSKTEDSNLLIPWYVWSCDFGENDKFYEINNRLMICKNIKTDKGVAIVLSALLPVDKVNYDTIASFDSNNKIIFTKKKIISMLQTKLFDFSASGYLKNVDRVSVGFGNNGGDEIKVEFINNTCSENEAFSLISDATNERATAFVTVKNFFPSARAIRTFGVKIECEGILCIEGLSIQYRMLGGVK